jgi:hypothetical protein
VAIVYTLPAVLAGFATTAAADMCGRIAGQSVLMAKLG